MALTVGYPDNLRVAVYKPISRCATFKIIYDHAQIFRLPNHNAYADIYQIWLPWTIRHDSSKLSVQLYHRYERVCRNKLWRMTGHDNEISRVLGISWAHNFVDYPTLPYITSLHFAIYRLLISIFTESACYYRFHLVAIWVHYCLLLSEVNWIRGNGEPFEPFELFELFSNIINEIAKLILTILKLCDLHLSSDQPQLRLPDWYWWSWGSVNCT